MMGNNGVYRMFIESRKNAAPRKRQSTTPKPGGSGSKETSSGFFLLLTRVASNEFDINATCEYVCFS